MEDALALVSDLLAKCKDLGVLILVVMEDALAQFLSFKAAKDTDLVLILVVMEDALARSLKVLRPQRCRRLNPCCNGRCTRTDKKKIGSKIQKSLNPCCNGRCTRTHHWEHSYFSLF